MTAENSSDLPETADPAPLERSQQLIDEARSATHAALAATEDDPAPETGTGQESPVPGDEQDPAERS